MHVNDKWIFLEVNVDSLVAMQFLCGNLSPDHPPSKKISIECQAFITYE